MRAIIDVGRQISTGCRSVAFTVGTHTDLAWKTQQLRRRIFVDGLCWKLSADQSGRERDQFDRKDTIYGAVVEDGTPVGCWRLLPTMQPYLLADVFPHLVDGQQLPRDISTWEISRFGVDPFHQQPEIVSRELLGLMMRFAVANGIATIVAVTDEAFHKVLVRAGLKLFRYPAVDRSEENTRGAIIAGGLHLADQTHPRYRKFAHPSQEAA